MTVAAPRSVARSENRRTYTFRITTPPHVLFLCSGNLCRSPMAEAMMRHRAKMSGSAIRVASAGFQTDGEASPEETSAVLRSRAIDVSQHRSRLVEPEMLQDADLVIGMTRAHAWDAALIDRDVVPKTFVLGEIVRLNQAIGFRKPREPFATWVTRLHEARRFGIVGISTEDEIPDPYGRKARVHERVAAMIDDRIRELADCAFDPAVQCHDERWRDGKIIWRP